MQIAGRALALVVVFAAVFAATAVSGIEVPLPLDPAYTPTMTGAVTSGALVFGWALADGRRPHRVARPVRLWVAVIMVAATTVTVLVLGFWICLGAAVGGSVSRHDLVPVAGFGVLGAALLTVVGTAVAAAGLRVGRSGPALAAVEEGQAMGSNSGGRAPD